MKRLVPFIVVAAIAAGIFFGYRAWEKHKEGLPLEWSGTVEAYTVTVGSRVGGRIKDVLVREGDHVKAGQPLLLLEPGDLLGQELQAKGQVGQAQANAAKVASHGEGPRAQEIAGARSRLEAQEAAVQKAQQDLKRAETLVQQKVETQRTLDDARTGLRNASAQRDALRSAVEELLRGTPQDVKAAQGALDAAQGRLQQIQSMLDELTIRAPRDARIETLDLRPGDILGVNAAAAKLLEPGQLFVRIYVPETQMGHIKEGLVVPVYVDTFPGRAFKAQVEAVSGIGEYTPRNLQTEDERADQVFAARLRIDEGTDILRAGMAAFARVPR
ncbi:MAG TPA: HlyD family efflux transporter periplasmic adaptor subunit [Myxococcales bacterium]|nr:HlyD family efflux transporter periplasmic adaptor subunit [Myxococcales bacterium]